MTWNGKRTPAGRYINHSSEPTAHPVIIQNNIFAVANRTLEGCKGGFDGNEITVDYRAMVRLRKDELCQQQ